MPTLRHPTTGAVIQASGRLAARLLAEGWTSTDEPASPGLRLVTAAELDAAQESVAQIQAAVANFTPGLAPRVDALEAGLDASQQDRAEIHAALEPIAAQLPEVQAEVDDLTATVQATTTAAAPKPTPRTDALEAWRSVAEPQIAALEASDPVPGPPGAAGVDGKSAYQLARDGGYGGTQTQWLASLVGPAGPASTVPGPPGADSTVPGPKGDKGDQGLPGLPGVTDYNLLTNKPSLHAVATSGSYADLANKPTIPTVKRSESVTVNSGALTANTVKNVTATFATAMPDTNYRVAVLAHSSTPQNIAIGLVSKATGSCVIAVRSTAAINANPGLNIDVTVTA